MGKFKLSAITPDRVRSAPVSSELMAKFLDKMRDQHGDGEGPADPQLAAFLAYVALTGRLPGKKAKPLTLSEHCTLASVTKRGFALASLVREGHFAHWLKNSADHVLLHPALIVASATTALKGEGETYLFDPPEFLMNALANAEINRPFVTG